MAIGNLRDTTLVLMGLHTARAQLAALETDVALRNATGAGPGALHDEIRFPSAVAFADIMAPQIERQKREVADLVTLINQIGGQLTPQEQEVYFSLLSAALVWGEVGGMALSLAGGSLALHEDMSFLDLDTQAMKENDRLRAALALLDEGRVDEARRIAADSKGKAEAARNAVAGRKADLNTKFAQSGTQRAMIEVMNSLPDADLSSGVAEFDQLFPGGV